MHESLAEVERHPLTDDDRRAVRRRLASLGRASWLTCLTTGVVAGVAIVGVGVVKGARATYWIGPLVLLAFGRILDLESNQVLM